MDYAIFREELALKYSSYGHALWKPSPEGRYPAVEVGDVGFIHEGYFHRLFNILLPRDDPSHPDGVPPGHEQLKLNINSPTNYTGTLHPNHLRSNGVSDTSDVDRRFVQDPDAAARLYFSCSNRRGALLSLPVPAQRQDTAVRREFTKFIIKHIDEWFAFAQGLGFGIHRREDIILVTGRDLTRSWANIAFQERDQKMSFGVQASRGSDVQWQFTPEGAGGVAFNLGPSGQDLPENQCIFVRGIRVSRITRIFPRLLGAAGPSQIPGDDDTESDAQPISIPANVDYLDPLHTILQYIAIQTPDCDMAVVHDDDLRCIGIESLETLHPDTLLTHLQKSQPEIYQVEFDCSFTSHSDKSGSKSKAPPIKIATLSRNTADELESMTLQNECSAVEERSQSFPLSPSPTQHQDWPPKSIVKMLRNRLTNWLPSIQETKGDRDVAKARSTIAGYPSWMDPHDIHAVQTRLTHALEMKAGLDSKSGIEKVRQAWFYRKAAKDACRYAQSVSIRGSAFTDATLVENAPSSASSQVISI